MARIFPVVFAVAALTATAESAPLGLVLSGGGAKGAYEVGVWQTLEEAGLASNITAISGTSVGALNAALFAMRPEAAERLWLETMGDVFTLNTNRIGQSLQTTVNAVSNAVDVAESSGKGWKGLVAFALSTGLRLANDAIEMSATDASRIGFIDSRPLALALDKSLPRQWPRGCPSVYATAVEKGPDKISSSWRLNGESHERRVLMLRASAAIPFGYDTVEIDGKTYVDGGWEGKGGDNVPLEPILENHSEIKKVIVVYLDTKKKMEKEDKKRQKKGGNGRLTKNREAAKRAGVEPPIEIFPSQDIGGAFNGWYGVFDASPDTAKRLIEFGRKDAERVLRESGLAK